MKQHERIVRDPKVMLGKPVIRGTRITVEHILRELGGGLAPEQIVAGYPHLTLEDIRAAQAYAADYMADEEVAYGQAPGRMQFLADECCHALIVMALRTAGHDVAHIQESQPGVSDDVVIAAAAADQRILITEDKDFSELVFRQRVMVPGLILLRLTTADPQRKAERLLTAITAHGERLNGQHLVILDSSIRWRPLLAAIQADRTSNPSALPGVRGPNPRTEPPNPGSEGALMCRIRTQSCH